MCVVAYGTKDKGSRDTYAYKTEDRHESDLGKHGVGYDTKYEDRRHYNGHGGHEDHDDHDDDEDEDDEHIRHGKGYGKEYGYKDHERRHNDGYGRRH